MVINWYKISQKKIDLLENKSGVYIISVLLRSGDFAVIYVGQSIDLKTRMKQHFSASESNEELKKYLSNNYTFKISYGYLDSKLLDGVEKYLIFKYSPQFNDKEGNGDSSFACNLPNVVKFPR